MYKSMLYKAVMCAGVVAAMVCVGCGDKKDNNPGGPGETDGYTLTVTTTNDTAGSIFIDPDREVYAEGDNVVVKATAKDGFGFAGWSGASTDTASTIIVKMDGNKELTAKFGPTHILGFLSSPDGIVSPNPKKDVYVNGDSVTITASANRGYIFERWIGLKTSENTTDSVVTITITRDREIGAMFKRVYIVTINIEPENAGIVEYYDDSHNKSYYDEGDTIRVIANPKSGYVISDWLVVPDETAHTKSNDLLTIVIGKEDVEVTAKFDTVTPLLTQGDE